VLPVRYELNYIGYVEESDRLCGLVVRVLATDSGVRVRFPALPHLLRSSGSGTRVHLGS
jgi:hypothetical protein